MQPSLQIILPQVAKEIRQRRRPRPAPGVLILRRPQNSLNNQLQTRIYWIVQSLKKILALVLVVAWSLAANHCKLEQLPGFQFMKCTAPSPAGAHPEDDCSTDGCASIESSFYKMEDGKLATVAPWACLAQAPPVLISTGSTQPAVAFVFVPRPIPPELSPRWQFVFRTAAPPRAPSSAS